MKWLARGAKHSNNQSRLGKGLEGRYVMASCTKEWVKSSRIGKEKKTDAEVANVQAPLVPRSFSAPHPRSLALQGEGFQNYGQVRKTTPRQFSPMPTPLLKLQPMLSEGGC